MSCTLDDMKTFISSLSVDLISCFDTKPRRRPHETAESVKDRKGFRICINEDDCHKFLDPSVWPDSVSVSEWFFMQQAENNGNNSNTNDKRRKIANYNIDNTVAPVEVYNQAIVSPSTLTDQVGVEVAAAAGDASTPSGENISMSDDETILENCPTAQ